MRCNYCGAEITDDSIFCELCGKKVKKTETSKSKKIIFILFGVLFVIGCVIGTLALINKHRWNSIYQSMVDCWPPCHEEDGIYAYKGDGVYFIVHEKYSYDWQKLIRVEGNFPIRIKETEVLVEGNIYACGGEYEHEGMGVFASLSNDGRISFHIVKPDECYGIGYEKDLYSDANHIYGYGEYLACGYNQDNVRMIFPDSCGQPVKEAADGKWRYLENTSESDDIVYYMFEDEFDDAYPYCYKIARVLKYGRWYYIDKTGQEVRIHRNDEEDVSYEVLEGGDFYYDYDKEKAVAEVRLEREKNGLTTTCNALIDVSGCILEESIETDRETPAE